MRKFSKLFSIIIAVSMLIYVFCINAMAVQGFTYDGDNYTLGGFDFSTYATLSINTANDNPRASATTRVRCEDEDIEQSTGISVSIYTNIFVSYMDGSYNYGYYLEDEVISHYYQSYGENYVNSAFADVCLSKTVEYIAAEHNAVNNNNLSDNGTVGTSIYFISNNFEVGSMISVILPGIDF